MLGLLNSRPHSRRSEFYHQLAQSINAGLTVPQALKVLQSSGLAGPYQACLTQWLQHLERGLTLEEAISVHPVGHFPSLDRSLMGAGERSGRLDTCLLSLSRYHQLNAANIRAMAQALAWPLLTLHAFFFSGPAATTRSERRLDRLPCAGSVGSRPSILSFFLTEPRLCLKP
jgi:type II secretory pathway component PulF